MTEPTLHLFTESLFSKWGFSDGDMPEALLDYCDERDIDYRDIAWHRTLERLVRERLVPALDAQVEVTVIGTSHNPIRASKVNGQDVEDCWYGEVEPPRLTPEYVEIPYGEVLALALRRDSE